MDHLDLTTKESKRKEFVLCAISGENLGKESVLTALVPKKPVALSVGSISVYQRDVGDPLVEDKNKRLTYKIHENNNEVNFREQIESSTLSPTIGGTDKGNKSSNVSSCEQTRSNALSSTSPTVYNTERRITSEDQNNLDKAIASVGSKCSDKVASDKKTDLDSLYDGITNSQKGVLVDGTEPKGLGTVSNNKIVHQYDKTALRSKKKNKGNLTGGKKTMFSKKGRLLCEIENEKSQIENRPFSISQNRFRSGNKSYLV